MSDPAKLLQQGLAQLRAQQHAEAERSFRAVLATHPSQPEALHGIGVLLAHSGRLDKAMSFVEEALRGRPDNAEFAQTLARILFGLGRLPAAAKIWQRRIDQRPDDVRPYYELGLCYDMAGNVRAALDAYIEAVRRQPTFPEAHHRIGGALAQLGQREGAIEALRTADAQQPNHAPVESMLGMLLAQTGQIGEGIVRIRRATQLAPRDSAAAWDLGTTAFMIGDLTDATAELERCIALTPDWPVPYSDLLLVAQHAAPDNPQQQLAMHREFDRRYASRVTRLPAVDLSARRARAGRERLRIAYVSGGFHAHPVARFIAPLLESHDRARFEVHAFSTHAAVDDLTERVRRSVTHFHQSHTLSDQPLAAAIRAAEIDVLVDLDGHSGGNRLMAFAQKPAPVQLTYLGYPNTTGLSAIDGRITDVVADPPGVTDAFHVERLLRLPATFAAFEPIAAAPPVAALPLLRAGHLTLASAAKPAKVTDLTLQAWSDAMRRLPGARLVLIGFGYHDAHVRESFERRMRRTGLDPSRVEFAGRKPFPEYLALHERFDLMLDTIPFNGHTTTVQHLWMGVPMVTCAGVSHRSRLGASVLSSVRLSALIAEGEERFADHIVAVASDADRLATLRREMRDRMLASPLMNVQRFARDFERQIEIAFTTLGADGGTAR